MPADRWDRKPKWQALDYLVAAVVIAAFVAVAWVGYVVLWMLLG